ncbi:MAG: hypothetical protein ACI88C_002979 [Acidimicrobiales bacterium]
MVATLPETTCVDTEVWGGEPTFRVRNKNYLFANKQVTALSFKFDKEEEQAVVASGDAADLTGYGLGRHGRASVTLR